MRYITREREDSTEMEEEEEEEEEEHNNDNNNWFSKWEEQLPPPDKLTPLSQTLITPDLALAFNISSPTTTTNFNNLSPPNHNLHHQYHHRSTPPDFDTFSTDPGGGTSSGGGGGGGNGSGGDEPARTLKRPRLVWTPQLHKRFVDAVAHLGIKNAVPKTIMQLMSVDGLTRENVASHLQKYRLYLKRMQGINNGVSGGGRSGRSSGGGSGDSATDRLFASSPVPAHFLHQGSGGGGNGTVVRANSEQFFPCVPPPVAMTAAFHHHHHQQQQQMVGVGIGAMTHHNHHRQMGIHHQPTTHRQTGHFGSTHNGEVRRFEHQFSTKMGEYVEDLGSESTGVNGRKVLTLFPTADD